MDALTDEKRNEISFALDTVQATQTAFWEALGELEDLLGFELDSDVDYEGYDVASILALGEEKNEESEG